MSSANLSVLVGKNFACIKICGRANFASSPDFKALLNGLEQKGFKRIIMELGECVLMDSTFLGVLAGFGMKINPNGASAELGIELHNPTARVGELLENLGAAHLFKITDGPLQLPADLTPCAAQSTNPTHEEITRTSLEAHETLMRMNPENVARFKDVAQFLAEDLKSLEKAG
jgi:anti-anti-sigma regulatory factor